MVRSGLVKYMPAKTGYFRMFSESVLTGVNISIFVNLKIKTYQNKHAFYTFEGSLNLGITMIFCGVFGFSSSELVNLRNFRYSPCSDCCDLQKIYFNVFPKTKVISFTYDRR